MSAVTTTVLVAIDGSENADDALAWAAEQAHYRHARLVILTASRPIYYTGEFAAESYGGMAISLPELARAHHEEALQLTATAAAEVAKLHPDVKVETAIYTGDPREGISSYAERADLVVLGSRGLGPVRSLMLGSVGYWATRQLDVPVAIVRPRAENQQGYVSRVACGVAPDGRSEHSLREAFADAARRDLELVVGSCRWDSEATRDHWVEVPAEQADDDVRIVVTELCERVAKDFPGVRYQLLFARGAVDQFLSDLGARSELLVMGRHQSSALDYLGIGTVASAVVEHAHGVTLVVPTTD